MYKETCPLWRCEGAINPFHAHVRKQLREREALGWWTAVYHLYYWKCSFGECGFGPFTRWTFWNFILESDSLNHPSPGIAGPWKLAGSRESLLLPSRRVQNSPSQQAGRPHRGKGGRRSGQRGQVIIVGNSLLGVIWGQWINESPLAAPDPSKEDQTRPCSQGIFSGEGRWSICALIAFLHGLS